MELDSTNAAVLKTHKHKNVTIDLVRISTKEYCVRRTIQGKFFGNTIEFFDLDKKGTTMTYPNLIFGVNMGTVEAATTIFNANLVAMGGV